MATDNERSKKLVVAIRILGVVVGLTCIAYGISMLFLGSDKNARGYIANFYLVCFGILIVIAEARLSSVLTHFKFMQTGIGMGAFYIFVGFMALSSDWWCYVMLAICCTVGFVYCIAGCVCQRILFPSSKTRQAIEQPGVA
ncbi:hypothetical protein AAMO2058_001126700 [Amorphochlora amoebiformis]